MKRRFLMLFLLLSVCSCAFLSTNSLSFFPAERFAAAQTQWQNGDIQSYEAVIQVGFPFSAFVQYRSVVQNGQLTEIGQRGGLSLPGMETPDFDPESFDAIPLDETTSLYTIEGLMSFANDTIGSTTPIVEFRSCGRSYWDAEYDTAHGYIRSLRMNCGTSLLGCVVSDCGGGYTVLSFTPLP